jgi:hypothetical protein
MGESAAALAVFPTLLAARFLLTLHTSCLGWTFCAAAGVRVMGSVPVVISSTPAVAGVIPDAAPSGDVDLCVTAFDDCTYLSFG